MTIVQYEQIPAWRRDVRARLDVMESRTRVIHQYMEARGIDEYEDVDELLDLWAAIKERLPSDIGRTRERDLDRHLNFAEQIDFRDIYTHDIPSIISAVDRYGTDGDEHVRAMLDELEAEFGVWDLIHPAVQDAARDAFNRNRYNDAARLAVEALFDHLKRVTGSDSDGDAFIRAAVGTNVEQLAFSDCATNSERNLTNGFKMIFQGLNKGVRNPLAHQYSGFSRIESFQIMVCASLLLSRSRLL